MDGRVSSLYSFLSAKREETCWSKGKDFLLLLACKFKLQHGAMCWWRGMGPTSPTTTLTAISPVMSSTLISHSHFSEGSISRTFHGTQHSSITWAINHDVWYIMCMHGVHHAMLAHTWHEPRMIWKNPTFCYVTVMAESWIATIFVTLANSGPPLRISFCLLTKRLLPKSPFQ